jgi:hypothetical protein
MSTHDLLREILVDVLRAGGAQIGARVGLEVRRSYELRTRLPLDLRRFGFEKLRDLLQANSDVVEISPDPNSHDILVSLKGSGSPEADTALQHHLSSIRLPTQLWQAFTNPDDNRRRYLNRRTGEVAHYREACEETPDRSARSRIDKWGNDAVEIQPVPGDAQLEWMREFISSIDLPERSRDLAKRILVAPYSSVLNTSFLGAIGSHGPEWKRRRGRLVVDFVKAWCDRNDVQYSEDEWGVSIAQQSEHTSPASRQTLLHHESRRSSLHELIEALPEEHLDSILVPATALAKLLDDQRRR